MVPNYQNSKEISLKAGWVQVHPTRGSTLILFFFLTQNRERRSLGTSVSPWEPQREVKPCICLGFFFFSWSARPPVKKKNTGGTQRCNSIDVRSQTLQRSTGRTIYGENDHVPFSKKVLPWTNIHSKPSDKIRIKQQSVNTPLISSLTCASKIYSNNVPLVASLKYDTHELTRQRGSSNMFFHHEPRITFSKNPTPFHQLQNFQKICFQIQFCLQIQSASP